MSDQPTTTDDKDSDASTMRFVSLNWKIVIAFTLVFAFIFTGSYYWFFQYTTESVLETLTDDMRTTLDAAAEGMDKEAFQAAYADALETDRCLPEPDAEENGFYPEDSEAYLAHVTWLKTVQDIEPRARFYTYVAGPGTREVVAIGSTGYFREPRGGFRLCQRYTPNDQSQIDMGLVEATYINEPYDDGEFGQWISGYRPIYDDDGEIIGAIGIDFAAEYYYEVRNTIINSTALAFVLSYGLGLVLVFVGARNLTQPLRRLTEIAERIAEGDYSHNFAGLSSDRLNDEVDTLARVFEVMIQKVSGREKKLKERVEALEIQLDTSKRDKAVNEIVSTDYFSELQDKAQELRERRRGQKEVEGDPEEKP